MRHPLVHFLLLGGLLFALERGITAGASGEAPAPISISAERLEELRRRFRGALPPSEAELAALIRSEVDDELMLRRARALGLDRDDPVIRRRLVQNLRFAGAAAERDDDALFEEALALGMDRTDVVVRRRLIQRMRLLIESRADAREPDEEELRAYLEAHADRFAQPARVRITQLFFDRARAGEARRLAERMRAEGTPPERALHEGDAFLHTAHQPPQSQAELASRFGVSFARRALALEPGAWSEPVESPYGVHLVWAHERSEARPASLAEVRDAVRHALLAERRQRELRDTLAAWRSEVEVRIGSPPAS